MNSKITLIGAACMIGLSAAAAPVSPEQALGRVAGNGPAKVRSMMQSTPKLSYTARDARGTAAAYVFTPSDGVGFTILSADDCAVPVLGYSESGVFDAANMPPAMKWWLEEYGRQIEYAARHGAKSSDDPVYAPQGWTPVAPLCTTKWNQDAPYNVTTPKVNDRNCPTGCVATSLAQVVNYFKYPGKMSGFASYLWEYGEKTIKMNFENVVFDWSLMLDSYTTSSPQKNIDAVAQLMKACGYSVQMNYGPDMSGTTSYKIMDALKNNFGYDAGVSYLERARYSTSEWTKMVYDNIKNIGPVIYNGSSIDGGHSFVCDGYDGKGYFHINWGWGGVSDGYFLLDALDPEVHGIGGADSAFNFMQDAVVDIRPDRSGTSEFIGEIILGSPLKFTGDWRGIEPEEGEELPELINGQLTLPNYFPIEGFAYNPGPGTFTDGYVGVAIDLYGDTKNDAVEYPYFTYNEFHDDNLAPRYGYDGVIVEFPELPDGTYSVRSAYALGNDPTKWSYARTQLNSSPGLILTISDGLGTFAEETRELPEVIDLDMPVEFGNMDVIRVSGKWTLASEVPYYSTYYPILLKGDNLAGIGTQGIVDLEAGGTAMLDFKTSFTTQRGQTLKPGKYDFCIGIADSEGQIYAANEPFEITLTQSSGIEDVKAESEAISIEYFAPDGTRLAERPEQGIYIERTTKADGTRTVTKRVR